MHVGAVDAVPREPDRFVETDRGGVGAVDEQHAGRDAVLGDHFETADHQRPPEARSLPVGIDADDVDLAERCRLDRRSRGVDLRPAESGELKILVEGEQEVARIEPRLASPLPEGLARPTPLLGVAGECSVVDRHPGIIVMSRLEGADGESLVARLRQLQADNRQLARTLHFEKLRAQAEARAASYSAAGRARGGLDMDADDAGSTDLLGRQGTPTYWQVRAERGDAQLRLHAVPAELGPDQGRPCLHQLLRMPARALATIPDLDKLADVLKPQAEPLGVRRAPSEAPNLLETSLGAAIVVAR